jgi:uncharacterized protein with von Willebrand factor type A (vWA) domain
VDDFLRQWLDKPDVTELSRQTIKNDHWDRKYVNSMLESIDDFMINHERLVSKVETGSPMWSDLFWMLWKYEPQPLGGGEIQPSHLINHLVSEELMSMSDYTKLKLFCEGDDVSAAMACIDLRQVVEQLFDKMEQLKDQLQQLQQTLQDLAGARRDLDELVEQWQDGFNPDEEQALQDKIAQLEASIEGQGRDLEEEMQAARAQIASELRGAMPDITDNAEAIHAQQDLWGPEDGSLQRLPAQERIELARKFQSEKFRRLLDMIGPMRRIMEEAQMRRVDYARDEVHTLSLGDDLQRCLPAELMKLHHPVLKLDFYKKFAEKELPQYEYRGKEKVGKGEIIACVDTSGSMHGDKEMCAKATALCALHYARKQKRGFYGILFSSANQIAAFDFGLKEEVSPHKVLDFAETNFFGGTDFVRPLSAALDRLRQEFETTGKVKGDIIFITDGIASVPDAWLKEFKAEQERLEFKVWGFLIGGHSPNPEPLATITDGNIVTVKDLLDGAFVGPMFGQL